MLKSTHQIKSDYSWRTLFYGLAWQLKSLFHYCVPTESISACPLYLSAAFRDKNSEAAPPLHCGLLEPKGKMIVG